MAVVIVITDSNGSNDGHKNKYGCNNDYKQ